MKLSIALILSLALVRANQQSDGVIRHRQVRRNDGDTRTKIKSLDRTSVEKGDKKDTQTKNKESTQKEAKKEKDDSSKAVEDETKSKAKESKKEKDSKKEKSSTEESTTVTQKDQKKAKMDTMIIQQDTARIDVADIVPGGDKQKNKKREDKKKKNSEEPEDVATVEQVEESTPTPATAASMGTVGRGTHMGRKHTGRGNGLGRGYKLNGGANFSAGKSDKEMDEYAMMRKRARNNNRKKKTRGVNKISVSGVDAEDYKKKTTSVYKTRTSRGRRIGGRTAVYDSKSAKS